MALLNIGAGNKDDAFYRYKMPKMITKIEGRGNGIKTNIVNMVDIAKALSRPASYTTKYFGCELGAQSKFDEKTGTSHVNGAHDTAKLAALLEVFIKKYVQCYGCGNPETEIIITKSQMINLNCAACGFISDVDMRDKLTTFILKNPPEQKKKSKDKKVMRRAEKERLKEGEVADEEQKKLKREAAKKKGSSGCLKDMASKASAKKKGHVSDEDHSPTGSQADETEAAAADDSEDDVQWQTDTSMEAARQRIQEQLSTVTAGMVMLSTNEEKSNSGNNSPARDKKPKINGLKSVNSRERLDKIKDDGQVKGLKSVNSRERLDKIKDDGQVKGLKSVHSRERLDKMKDDGQVKGLKSVHSRERLDKIKDDGQVKGLKSVHSRERLDKIKDDGQVKGLKSVNSRERLDKIKDDGQVNGLKSVHSHERLDKIKNDGQLNELKSVHSHERLVGEIKDYLKKGSPAAGQLKSFLASLSGTHQEIVDSLFEALFSEIGKGFSKEVVKKKNYLVAATLEEGSKLVLLHAIESFCEKASPDAVKEVALVLKALYDNDVVEEEFILEWYEKGVKGGNKDSPVWKNVKPFVEWLQSAESESEEE